MTQYLLTIYQPDGDPPPPEVLEPIMRDVTAVEQDMKAAGAWVFTGHLHPPSTATVIRGKDDDLLLTDGPYLEGREHVGGFTVVSVPDIDAALAWGRKLAAALHFLLPVEVRPFYDADER